RWLLVGCGKSADFNVKRFASALASAVGALRGSGTKEAISYLAYELPQGVDVYQAARHTVEVARAQTYRFDELKSRTDPAGKLARIAIGLPKGADVAEARRGIKVGTAVANGTDLARDLGNRPPN